MIHVVNKPCGHSFAAYCSCYTVGQSWTTTTFNGLCECRGPLDRHPFHSQPLPAGYVGKHRPKETP